MTKFLNQTEVRLTQARHIEIKFAIVVVIIALIVVNMSGGYQ